MNMPTQSFFQTTTCFFEDAPIPILVEDFSAAKLYFESLKKKSIRDFRTHFERHPEEVVSLAQEIKIIDVNKATLRLYQAKDKEELLSKRLNKIFGKESYETFKEELISFAEGKREFTRDAFNLTLKEEGIFFLLRVVVPTGYENTLSRVLAYIIDVTVSKAREEQLRQSEEKYWKIFNSAPNAMLVADVKTGFLIEANEEAGFLLGKSPEQIRGMHFTEIHPKEERERYQEVFRRHTSNDKAFSDQLAICDRNSRWKIPISISSSLVEIKEKQYIIKVFRAKRQEDVIPNLKAVATRDLQRRLTEREREIVQLIAIGYTSKQVAAQLFISEKTVGTHRTRIMKKLDFHHTADLVRYAITSGLCNSPTN